MSLILLVLTLSLLSQICPNLTKWLSGVVYAVSSALDSSSNFVYPPVPLFSFRSQPTCHVSQEAFPESHNRFGAPPLLFPFSAQCLAITFPLVCVLVRLYICEGEYAIHHYVIRGFVNTHVIYE